MGAERCTRFMQSKVYKDGTWRSLWMEKRCISADYLGMYESLS